MHPLKTTNARKGITTDTSKATSIRVTEASENNECPQGHYDQRALHIGYNCPFELPLKTTNARKGITTVEHADVQPYKPDGALKTTNARKGITTEWKSAQYQLATLRRTLKTTNARKGITTAINECFQLLDYHSL